MLDTAAEGEKAFKSSRDFRLDFFRRHSRIESGNNDFGDIDGGKQIHGHANQARNADDGDNQTDHNDEVRISNRKSRHHFPPLVWALEIIFG